MFVGSQEEASGSLSQQGHRPRLPTEPAAVATAALRSFPEPAQQADDTAAGAGPLVGGHSLPGAGPLLGRHGPPGEDAQEGEQSAARGRVTEVEQAEDRMQPQQQQEQQQQQHSGMLGDLPDKPGHLATVEQCLLANGGVCWHLLQMAVRARQIVQKSSDAKVRSKLSCRPCSLHQIAFPDWQ